MSEKKRGRDREEFPLERNDAELPALVNRGPQQTQKRIRKVSPLGLRVMVRIVHPGNTTDAGLYLPEGAKENMQESIVAQVLEVASAVDDDTDEETNVSGIPFGAMVLIAKTAGIKVPWDDNLRIVETREVLALVEEVELT